MNLYPHNGAAYGPTDSPRGTRRASVPDICDLDGSTHLEGLTMTKKPTKGQVVAGRNYGHAVAQGADKARAVIGAHGTSATALETAWTGFGAGLVVGIRAARYPTVCQGSEIFEERGEDVRRAALALAAAIHALARP